MDSTSNFEGFVLDPSKCSKLGMEEKRELVYEVSKWSQGAPELLQSWSRQEILEILCAEMGKERKYTGLTKLKIIENLLKVVSEKRSQEANALTVVDPEPSSISDQRTPKRPRKTDHPNRLTIATDTTSISFADNNLDNVVYCKNSACRAKLSQEYAFCKRCSCCVCHQYDDNKDPSLWLTCSSEPPFQGNSCGMSCHLECALRHERSGIAKDGQNSGLDGSFCCVTCGKVNDLLGCWRKQVITARDTRRVDILCYRVSLSQKLLSGTKRYQKLDQIVHEAMTKLEADVGPVTGLPVKKARGIVNRLSSGQEVQRLCAFAVESLDSLLSKTSFDMSSASADPNLLTPIIRFEHVGPTSLTVILGSETSLLENVVGYTLWNRKIDDTDYPIEPTCKLLAPTTRWLISGLAPATRYLFKVVSFDCSRDLGMCEIQVHTGSACEMRDPISLEVESSHSPATNSSSVSNPSSVEDENNTGNAYKNENDKQNGTILADLSNDDVDCNGMGQHGTRRDSLRILDEVATAKVNSLPTSDAGNLDNGHSPEGLTLEDTTAENDSNTPRQKGKECGGLPMRSSEGTLPTTPLKIENFKNIRPKISYKDLVNRSGREEGPQDGCSSKKRTRERQDEECAENGDRDFGYYVKVIRWLECEGHIETSFRQKFLTWYSLRASSQEVRVVKVFVDTLIEDPACLAGQLIDTFSEVISNKRCSALPGFCLKLWH